MGFSNTKDYADALTSDGKYWHSCWQKTTGAAPYTAGRWYDTSLLAGCPRPNVYPGGLLTATRLWYQSKGNIWHNTNVSPDTKHVVSAAAWGTVATSVPSVLLFCDYIMFYPLIDLDDDSIQTFDNTLTLPRYTDGKGVMAFIVTTVDTGAVAYTFNITYTNSEGASRTMPYNVAGTASGIAGHLLHTGTAVDNYGPFLPLANGDRGIRSVESIKLSTGSGAGWGCLVLCKPLFTLPIYVAGVAHERDMLLQIPSLPRVRDEAFLSCLIFTGAALAAASTIQGKVELAWS